MCKHSPGVLLSVIVSAICVPPYSDGVFNLTIARIENHNGEQYQCFGYWRNATMALSSVLQLLLPPCKLTNLYSVVVDY